MSASMSVSLLSASGEEGVVRDLQRLRSALNLSYGPLGVGAVFQPSPGGGRVTVTSLSQRLLPMLQTSSSSTTTSRLLVDSLISHSQTHRDSGLFAGLLTTGLILHGLDLHLPRRQVSVATSHALSLVASRLGDPSSGGEVGKCSVDLSSRHQVSSLVRSLLTSKTTVTQLSNSEIDHLTTLLVKCFLLAVPKKSGVPFAIGDRVSVHTSLGRPVSQSSLHPGLLLESCGGDWEGVRGEGVRGEGVRGEGVRCEGVKERVGRCEGDIVTALFDVSMAGDLPDDFPRDVQLTTEEPLVSDGVQEIEAHALRQLMRLGSCLVEEGVGFVGCQKVVHPLLKDYWRERGVCVMDRLSTVHLGPLRDITGGSIISSLSPDISPNSLGRLQSITHTTVHGKRYVVLEGGAQTVGHCSLVISCHTESVAEELNLLCSSALHILQQSLRSPYVLNGGGCTETLIRNFLLEKAAEEYSSEFLTDLQCSEKTFRTVMRSVAVSFQSAAASLEHHGGTVLSDTFSHHCWFLPPHNWVSEDLRGRSPDGVTGREGTECGCTDPERRMDGLRGRRDGFESVLVSDKTCGCGCVKLSGLPPTTKWIPLGADRLSLYPPDHAQWALERATSSGSLSGTAAVTVRQFPLVCDPFLPKLRAIETANDVASTILRISFSVSERT